MTSAPASRIPCRSSAERLGELFRMSRPTQIVRDIGSMAPSAAACASRYWAVP
jgi:hypothetical protein